MNLLLRLWFLLFTIRHRHKVNVLGPSISNFRVLPNDLDVLRHMNNGRYFSILDLARVDLMARSGLWLRLKKAGWYPVVVEESITFRRSLRLFQTYQVHTTVIGWDDKHILMQQTFCCNDIEVAIAKVKARFLKKTGGSVPVADLLKLAGITQASPQII
jgi:YbgC/YbaW family acyl-CoA thioester hydrolase